MTPLMERARSAVRPAGSDEPLPPAAFLEPVKPTVPSPPKEHRRLHELYFPRHLNSIIRRERARADRQKGQFAVVMFRLVPARSRWATLRLSRLVLNEVRTADEVGQYDRDTTCAILPDTTVDGARKLIDRVYARARAKGMVVEPVIYTYPTHSDGSGGSGSDATGASPPRTRLVTDADYRPSPSDIRRPAPSDTLPLEILLERPPGILKRALDVTLSAGVLLATAPLLAAIAVLIKLSSPGPVVFKQWRSGMGGRPFQIYKFRTMCAGADAMKAQLRAQSEQDGPAFKMTHDPRVTRIGHLLRKTSLDELPQLVNVLKGDMSLVGPRPLPLDEQAQCDHWHRGRLDVRPGLTCVWQVHGRSRVSFEEWMRMDLKYIKHSRILHDLRLIVATIPAVLLRRGAK